MLKLETIPEDSIWESTYIPLCGNLKLIKRQRLIGKRMKKRLKTKIRKIIHTF